MTTILLIGAGNMGFAMAQGWLRTDPTLTLHVVEPHEPFRARAAEAGAHPVATLADLPPVTPDLVVLAVKPQMVARVLSDGAPWPGATFVSIAAGITLAAMARPLPPSSPIIRCMPNTPAAIGLGMLVLCVNAAVSPEARALTERLLAASGRVAWLNDKGLMDAVTAISGSGPAHVFHFIEALTAAAISLGLPPDLAGILSRQTVAQDGDPGALRAQVTSPGGTTPAALQVFMADQALVRLVQGAAQAAKDRGTALGKEG